MINREELEKILQFVADRWKTEIKNPDSKPLAGLPKDFWMNSVGGRTIKGGFWVTTVMYTESEADAASFREVLLRWQAKGSGKDDSKGPDLIQIGKKKSP